MNEIFLMLGIESWKPVLTALMLPPVPLLLLTLLGARLMFWRRAFGWLLVLTAVAGIWLSACAAVGYWLLEPMSGRPLAAEQVQELKRAVAGQRTSVAIVVLGGGRDARAPEYGTASLNPYTLERLRYGLWLARETGAPVLFSGGIGHAAMPGVSEAEVAADVASREFGRPLRWTETRARDTRENAAFSSAALRDQGVQRLVLVTHGWHMPRALRAFDEVAQREKAPWRLLPAPMGLAQRIERPVLRWIPTTEGYLLVRMTLRERIGLWLGA